MFTVQYGEKQFKITRLGGRANDYYLPSFTFVFNVVIIRLYNIVVFCCIVTSPLNLYDLHIESGQGWLALWHLQGCPGVSEVILNDMGKSANTRASYQIRKNTGYACIGNGWTVFSDTTG